MCGSVCGYLCVGRDSLSMWACTSQWRIPTHATWTHCNTMCNTARYNPWLTVRVRMQRPMANFNTHNVHRTLQHTAAHCATRCNRICDSLSVWECSAQWRNLTHTTYIAHGNTLQHTVQHAATKSVTRYLCKSHEQIPPYATYTTHCNTLRNTLQPNQWLAIYAGPTGESNHPQRIQHNATHCITLCNTLQHSATRCATRCNQIRDLQSMQVPLANPITRNVYKNDCSLGNPLLAGAHTQKAAPSQIYRTKLL